MTAGTKRWAALTVAAVLFVLVLPAGPASAHATLLFTSPTVDGAVPNSPPIVQLVFDQPVVAGKTSLSVLGDNGQAATLGPVQTGEDSSVVRAQVLEELPAGEYRVEWLAVALDGDSMIGDFRFVVGSGSVLNASGSGTETQGALPLAVLRWSLFAGFAVVLGGLVGGRLTRRTASAPEPWLKIGAGTALASAVGLAVLVAGVGSFASGLDPDRVLGLVDSTPGLVAVVEVAALAIGLGALVAGQRRLAGVAVLAVPVAEGFRAHPGVEAGTWGVVLIAVHLTAVAVWAGALVHVVRVGIALRLRGGRATPVVRAYARMALALFLIVSLTGTIAALAIIPLDDVAGALLGTSYGRWLLIKLSFVLLVAALATWARLHLGRHPEAVQPAISARAELVAIAGVVAISSVLTVLAPPISANSPLAFPPPDVGPSVGLGSRTGFIGVGVSASQGQVVVKLTAPRTVDTQNREQEAMNLIGNVAPEGSPARRVEFRRCGVGCFVAPVTWVEGDNVVTVRVDDATWGGGSAAVTVAWPPRSEERRLEEAVDRIREVEHFTLHEQVTSNTATGLGKPIRLRFSGLEYLAAGPFGSGRAVTVTRHQVHPNGEVTLALAYPAEKVFVLLTVDRQNRIVREVLASGEHLVTRTLVYDERGSHEDHRHDE
ncbi:copper resistance protein CopC [Nocardioides sp.]|uniref:copper resistance CopC/CopD family protein n=1 Tax=Nocardioides sp. TaxID=35761 RepID=UPI002CAC15E5|nr:copper resistance protein CopC [Nocardioides sp.]HXH78740.1 copper resistance protein CopC [Nocardioides sp.]